MALSAAREQTHEHTATVGDTVRGTGVANNALEVVVYPRLAEWCTHGAWQVRGLASKQGFDVSVLEDVSQVGCPAAV